MHMLGKVLVCGLTLTSPAAADNIALLIGNENYTHGRDISGADDLLKAADPLREAGFNVVTRSDGTVQELQDALTEFEALAEGNGSTIIALSGHFVQAGNQTWLLGAEAESPAYGSVGAAGIPLGLALDLAARAQGKAAVLIGIEDRDFPLGQGVTSGLATMDVPQGVTVIVGPADEIADFARDALPRTGQSLSASLEDYEDDFTVEGFQAPLLPFIDVSPDNEAAEVDQSDTGFWQAVNTMGSREAYESYLQRYPQGAYATQARAEITAIDAAPAQKAQAEEERLNLSRDARRELQRNLSLIGFDPKGIDGLIGPGSRAAISAFQRENGFEETGYITSDMLDALQIQAERRAAVLEEEARIRQAEIERKDRAYWNETGALGDEAGLRAYLKRYPDGVFAEIAQARLQPFEDARRAEAEQQDRAAWDRAQEAGTLDAYRAYQEAYPNGAFVSQAQTLIDNAAASEQSDAEVSRAQQIEANLRLNATNKRLIEERLDRLGLKPGEVDGEFNEKTRRAIRRYQEARNMPKTGYIDQTMIVRLLAEAILQ